MRAIITNSYYTTSPLTIHWIGRKEDGERLFMSFPSPIKPYFFAETENGIQRIEVENPMDVRKEREKYPKVWESDIPFADRVLADMGFKKSMDIDTLKPAESKGINLRRFSIDIETDDTVPLNINDPQGEILEIGIRDYYKNFTVILTTIQRFNLSRFLELKFQEDEKMREALTSKGLDSFASNIGNLDVKIVSFQTERDMLKFYYDFLHSKNYGDVNVGWNIGKKLTDHEVSGNVGFDIPYIQRRSEKYGLKIDWDKIIINFDLMEAYMNLEENELESFSLEYISQRELGIGKIKHDMGYKEMYTKDPEKFMVYHYRDMLLVQLIDLKRGIFDFYLSESEKVGSLDIGRWNANYLIDTLLLHELHGTEDHLPSATIGTTKIKIQGGKVFIAVIGRFEIVVVLDFSSEYPSIMETFNLSHDTITTLEEGDIKIPELGYGFTLKKKGFIPRIIGKLKNYRKEIKREMKKYEVNTDDYKRLDNEQRVVKELTNAFYGVEGNASDMGDGKYRYSRLYEPRVQQAITYLTRQHIQFVVDKLRSMDIEVEVKYGDTDSVMIHKEIWKSMKIEDVIVEVNSILKEINSSFPDFVRSYGGDPSMSTLEMKFEKIYSSWIQTGAKKNYSGRVIYKDGVFVTPYTEYRGMAPRRSDKSNYTKKFITRLVELSHEDVTKSWAYYISEEERWNKKDKSLIPLMGIYISLNQKSYDNSYQPQKAVNRGIQEGINLDRNRGKFKMYFLTDGPIAVNFDDQLPEKYYRKIDWDYHKRRCFILPSKGIVGIIQPRDMEDFETDSDDAVVIGNLSKDYEVE
jgi:DNA polymerase elongation subunit (family B)